MQAQDLFDDREKLRAQIAQQLKETQDLMKNTDSVTAKKINSIEEREDGARFLSRPVYPIYNYTDAKNDPTYLSLYGDTNKWIDISAKQYTPVYAPADGVVTSVRDANGISLNRIVLWHKYWYVTLMSSLHTVYVKQWQTVKRWQLLGISWGEPGTRWAWFASNGPKLHIEVFKNSQPIHPFTVMDLSVIQDPTIIPFEYEFKLLSDKESRQVKLDQVEIMPWKSLSERRQQYLEKYGFGEFGRLSVRQDASAWRNVDIDLGICIATAESSMGRNLSSARNVWNVWNNDRWDRIDFETPAQWASMIYYALENKFLWQYATIYDLSWYGNKAWAIYASSEINWITNVSRCLTAIKWYRVPEDRPFRLPPDTNTASTPKS